jgi:cell division protein FtsI (penicillin-binding protein 3)
VTQWFRARLILIYFSFVAFIGFVGFRLLQLQVWKNADLDSLANRQFQKTAKKAPFRLPIRDRNGEELAVNITAGSIFARPKLMTHRRKTAHLLSKILGGTPAHWLSRFNTSKPFVWIQRQVSEETAKKVAQADLPGVFVEPENRRVYPNESLAANVIGFTDIDGNGLSGLERSLNEELLLKETKFALIRDGKGNPSYIDRHYLGAEVLAEGIRSTLDRRIQNVVEEELDQALDRTGAKAVFAVVMNPYNGEILALGQRPAFDPNQPSHSSVQNYANRVVSHLFEPGSTMKVLFAAAAIQEGIMSSRTPIDCGQGSVTIGNRSIGEAESSHRFGLLPLEKVIRFSSNVGAVKIVQQLGPERVRHTIETFGLTSKTGVELPGEVTSAPRPEAFSSPFQLATMGFGQGIAVTPLQMVTAFSPLANGGYLVHPRIILKGEPSSSPRKILSPNAVDGMRGLLVGVTEEKGGTGIQARIPGIKVAGKTGTAQKYEGATGYEGKKYYSSFIGFLPADHPELLIGVMVDEPKFPFYASQVAAPLFRGVAQRSLQILGGAPRRWLAEAGPSPAFLPLPPRPKLELLEAGEGKWVMPNLNGASVRESLQVAGKFFQQLKIQGVGYVQDQTPKPGTMVTPATPVELTLSPRG